MMPIDLSRTRALFVQPHTDDVALSCGGLVARLADGGDHPVVVGVFTGPPRSDEELAPAVIELHDSWGLGSEPWRGRRDEDARACEVLGATPLWLDFQDAPYRPGLTTFESVFAPMAADDPLPAQIGGELLTLSRQSDAAVVYMPLGVGDHIDHQLCHAAAAVLERAGVHVRFYEDFPYAAMPGLLGSRLAALGAFRVERVDVTDWIERRTRAAEQYASQIKRLFRPDTIVPGPCDLAIRRHAAGAAAGLPGCLARGPRFAECIYDRVA